MKRHFVNPKWHFTTPMYTMSRLFHTCWHQHTEMHFVIRNRTFMTQILFRRPKMTLYNTNIHFVATISPIVPTNQQNTLCPHKTNIYGTKLHFVCKNYYFTTTIYTLCNDEATKYTSTLQNIPLQQQQTSLHFTYSKITLTKKSIVVIAIAIAIASTITQSTWIQRQQEGMISRHQYNKKQQK